MLSASLNKTFPSFVVSYLSILIIYTAYVIFVKAAISNKMSNLFVSVALISLVPYLKKDHFIEISYIISSFFIKEHSFLTLFVSITYKSKIKQLILINTISCRVNS